MADTGISFKGSDVTLLDGTGTPITKTVTLLDGTFEFSPTHGEPMAIHDKGTLSHFISGTETPGTFSFTCWYQEMAYDADIYPSGTISLYEFMTQTGAGSALVSTGSDGMKTFSLRIKLPLRGQPVPTQREQITLNRCVIMQPSATLDPNGCKIAFNGNFVSHTSIGAA